MTSMSSRQRVVPRSLQPRAWRRRCGTTLVELLVALPLTLLVAVMAVALLLHVARAARSQSARVTTARELRHARLILAHDLEALHGQDIVHLSDTLLEIRAHLGIAVLCGVPNGTTIDVALPEATPGVSWVPSVRAGDDLKTWALPTTPSDTPQVMVGSLIQAPAALGVGACGPAPMAPPRPRWRLSLQSAFAMSPTPGLPVSVGRPVRYRHYQSGARWWLGRRTRDAGGWDVTQPVAGPFVSRVEDGMKVSGYTRAGVPTTVPESLALLRITLRAPRREHDARSPIVDSATLEVALRAQPATRPLP